MLSPWWTNVLTYREVLRRNPFRKVPAREYLQHLLRTSTTLKGKIFQDTPVLGLEACPGDGTWLLTTTAGELGPYKAVVIATGYFSNPIGPKPAFESDGSVKVIHAAEIQDYGQLNDFRSESHLPVLVVGARVTAGQTVLALVDRGIACALSTRSNVSFRRHGLVAGVREMAYYVWEELEAACRPGLRRDSYPVMEGGRNKELIETGEVPVYPAISKIFNGKVEFADGNTLLASAIILATGYLPALSIAGMKPPAALDGLPKVDAFEVDAAPGLFLLGFDNLYDHRSRYLRGIRLDARRLARHLADFIAS